MQNTLLARLFGVVFVVLGVFALSKGLRDLRLAQASPEWPQVQGVIEQSQVAESKTKGKTNYYADIRYRYDVEGTAHSSGRVAFGSYQSTDRTPHEALVARYPAGSPVTVYYQPDAPESAVLEPGAAGQAWMMPGFGVAFILAGIGVAALLPRFARKSSSIADASPQPEQAT